MMSQDNLSDEYWSERYASHQTGWDVGDVSAPLKLYFDQLENKDIAILIPGCGNAYEAEYLLNKGFTNVSLIDISKTLTDQLQIKFEKFCSEGICTIIHGNFFTHEGSYDLIVEQTFFCALDPSLRQDYVRQMLRLLKPGGVLAGLLFNRNFEGGPPFGGTREEYFELFRAHFDIKILEECYNSIGPRAGSELFVLLKKPGVETLTQVN
jgi:SAM-dependent methyltransferase